MKRNKRKLRRKTKMMNGKKMKEKESREKEEKNWNSGAKTK